MAFTFGAYTNCLPDRGLTEALDIVSGVGLTGIELNTGGFIPSPQVHVDTLLASAAEREHFLASIAESGLVLSGFTCSGNPLSPLPEEGIKHAEDLRKTIQLAKLLGVKEIVAMSGVPGTDPAARYPAWVVNAWNGIDHEVLEYQWEVATEFWTEIDELAREAGVRIALELHPRNLVFNPVTFEQFVERVQPTNIGVNFDPSHLFWQQMEPLECIERLGTHIIRVHAKDTKVLPGARYRGVLDVDFTRPAPGDPNKAEVAIGRYVAVPPEDAAWRFVALGESHDVDYWARFLTALAAINPDLHINIEHEDAAYGQIEGLTLDVKTLFAAANKAGIS